MKKLELYKITINDTSWKATCHPWPCRPDDCIPAGPCSPDNWKCSPEGIGEPPPDDEDDDD